MQKSLLLLLFGKFLIKNNLKFVQNKTKKNSRVALNIYFDSFPFLLSKSNNNDDDDDHSFSTWFVSKIFFFFSFVLYRSLKHGIMERKKNLSQQKNERNSLHIFRLFVLNISIFLFFFFCIVLVDRELISFWVSVFFLFGSLTYSLIHLIPHFLIWMNGNNFAFFLFLYIIF